MPADFDDASGSAVPVVPTITEPLIGSPASASKSPAPNACVYTVLVGQYEALNEQRTAPDSTLPFICLTDDPKLRSDTWEIRLVQPTFDMDPIRSQRDLKIRPHVHLHDFEILIYIDNSMILKALPEQIFSAYFSTDPFVIMQHSFRDTLCDEFVEVVHLGFDDPQRVFEQLNHYAFTEYEILEQKPF